MRFGACPARSTARRADAGKSIGSTARRSPTGGLTKRALVSALLWLLLPGSAISHEFWVLPSSFAPAAGQPLLLRLYVGEFFRGECVPFTRTYVESLRHFSARGVIDEQIGQRSAVCEQGMRLRPVEQGSLLLAIDTAPRVVKLSGDKFTDYLLAEGLDDALAMRSASASTNQPGRERYRRHVKTLISVAGKSDATALASTGQRIEILPASPPQRWGPDEQAELRVIFDGKPLTGALLKAWHRHGGQLVSASQRTDARGHAKFALPHEGIWMFSVVHMIPAIRVPDADWDSFWGNLTLHTGPGEKSK